MQIKLTREDLLRPMNMVGGVVERRQTLPILSYVMLKQNDGALAVSGTDLEVEVIATLTVGNEPSAEMTLPARKLLDICRALPPGTQIILEKQGDKAIVRAGRSRFTLLSLPVSDFPSVGTEHWEQTITLPQANLKQLLDRTHFCMAQQDVRYYLNGLYLEFSDKQLRAVATDGHRMAVSDLPLSNGGMAERQCIVPRKGVHEISRLLGDGTELATLELGTNHVRVRVNGATFTSKLIDGRFPDYKKVIPSKQTKLISLDRMTFKDALGRVAILANEKYRGVRLGVTDGKLSLSAHNPEQEEASEELENSYRGESLEIGFNVSYLIDAVGALGSEEIVLGLNDSSSCCTLHSNSDPSTRYIVMPMRL